MPAPRILIVGGSTRAAADSVRRAGGLPVCADLFADLDLRMTAEVIPVRHYPDSLPGDVANIHADGWFYCGAMENHPEVLEEMLAAKASYGPLLGTPPQAVRLVRDPQWLAESLQSAGIRTLEIIDQSAPPEPDGTWLQKPLSSAGGRLIRVWDETAARIPFREPHYFQRAVSGVGISALFRVESGEMEFLEASCEIEAQLESQSPSCFSYCGSYGPWNAWEPLRLSIRNQLQAIANALGQNAPGLSGFIGLDFRLCGQDVWLTEVNPRYTASVEVLELATGRSLLHRTLVEHTYFSSPRLCGERGWVEGISSPSAIAHGDFVETKAASARTPTIVAKQILYAKKPIVAPDLSRFLSIADPWQVPVVADLPTPGSVIEPGWPICTVLADGKDIDATNAVLRSRLNMVRSILE